MSVDVHVVSHTHWDREWYLTREQYRVRLIGLIDRVLERLEKEPRFAHFHLDGQTVVLEDYLEVRPDREARLRRHVASGRLLVGPWYVMPDMHLVSGEALVRNLALGHRIAESFGGVMRAGYLPDPFGHVAQMPQILAGFGLDSAILWRGFGGERAEYWWQGPDGTRALLLHLPRDGYCNALRLPLLPADAMREAAAALVAREAERSSTGAVLLMAGVDHVEPHPALVEIPARLAEAGVRARISTLPAYVAAVRDAVTSAEASGGALETVQGELRAGEDYAFLLPGVLSARTYLKQANARIEALLERVAEPLTAFAWLAGEPYPVGPLHYAWKTLLQNHPHDSICGCSIDAVHEENVSRFARAEQAAAALASEALLALARRVPWPGPSLGVLLVNTASRAATGVLVGEVEVAVAGTESRRALDASLLEAPLVFLPRDTLMAVRDADGHPLPFQVLAEDEGTVHAMSRYLPPVAVRTRRLRLAVWHSGVPGCGYASLEIAPVRAGDLSVPPPLPPGVQPARAGERSIENGLLRLEVRPDGALDLTDLRSGRRLEGCLSFQDDADVGDEYDFSPAPRDSRVTSGDARRVAVRPVAEGPLRASLEVALELPVPVRATHDRKGRVRKTVALPFRLEVSLDAGSPRVIVQVDAENRAHDHRLRALVPTGALRVERSRADSAFAIVERPARPTSFPMQSCVETGDGQGGVTVFTEGLHEFEVVDSPSGTAIAVTLLRCVGALSRDDLATRPGHAGPGLKTPGAQCLGPHRFRLALEPWVERPAASELFAASASFLAPPRWIAPSGPVETGRSSLPANGPFLRMTSAPAGAAVLSALKRADDREALVLRVFNAEALEARLAVSAIRPVLEAHRLDLREERREELPVSDGALELVLRPFGIETIELVLADA